MDRASAITESRGPGTLDITVTAIVKDHGGVTVTIFTMIRTGLLQGAGIRVRGGGVSCGAAL